MDGMIPWGEQFTIVYRRGRWVCEGLGLWEGDDGGFGSVGFVGRVRTTRMVYWTCDITLYM